jgi:hypothetical protein
MALSAKLSARSNRPKIDFAVVAVSAEADAIDVAATAVASWKTALGNLEASQIAQACSRGPVLFSLARKAFDTTISNACVSNHFTQEAICHAFWT